MRRRLLALSVVLGLLFSSAAVFAGNEAAPVPEKVGKEHWACRDIMALSNKYAAEKKLPEAVTVAGANCSRGELAQCLLSVMDKVLEKCRIDGPTAIPKEDLDKIAALQEALKGELAEQEGYLTRRESIEKIFAKPEEPGFLHKLGVDGYLRGEGASSFSLRDSSYTTGHGEGRLVYRVKPYGYWHPTDWLDIHLEGEGYGFAGGSQEHNQLSLYQGFVEVKDPEKDRLALRGGRQEISYGSTFILGANSFYDGLTYDALRLRVRPAAPLTVDFFWGTYASPFDTGLTGDLAGGYATYTLSEGNAVEAYLLRDGGALERHGGEHLDIYGLRGTAKLGPVSLEFEPVYESGRRFNGTTGVNDGINAYGGHLDLTYDSILAGYKNRFLAGYAYGTGDRGAVNGDSFSREFRNPNNDSSQFGDIGIMVDQSGSTVNGHHASGLQIPTIGWGIDLTAPLNFTATGHYYYANFAEPGFSRSIGMESDFTLTYTMSEDLSLILGYDRFFTGKFFRDATGSGRDIDYGYAMLQFNLSKSKPRLKRV